MVNENVFGLDNVKVKIFIHFFNWKLPCPIVWLMMMMVVMMICFCGMVDQRKLLSLFSSRDYYQRFLPSQPPVHFELDWSCTEPESRLRWVQLWISDNHYTDTYKTFRFLVQRFFKFFSWMRQKWQKVYWSYYIKPYQTTGDTSSNPISFPRWMVRIICNMRINLSWCSRYHQGFYSYWLSWLQ